MQLLFRVCVCVYVYVLAKPKKKKKHTQMSRNSFMLVCE